MKYDSTRSEFIALAKDGCAHCLGLGLRRSGRTEPAAPCNCVLRSMFRACYERFKLCASREKHMSHARLEQVNGKEQRHSWGIKDAEYMADFCMVSRRSLTDDEYRIFRFYFLLGADWKLCCRRLNMDRGNFFHALYRIQQHLGNVFRELQPYALYPVDEYFGGSVRKQKSAHSRGNVILFPMRDKVQPLRPPLRKVA